MKEEYIHSLSDDEIVEGLRNHDSIVTREYFYQYCRIAYAVNDRRYDLANKPGLDFYSIAHEYYLSLEKNGFRQLDDRNSDVSLKTWMINGFRFVLLDRLKAYKTEFGKRSVEERIDNMCKRVSRSQLHFDIPDDSYRKAVRDMVEEVCNDYYGRDDVTSIILKMLLVEGYKTKDVAEQMSMTPSAVSQRYHKALNEVLIPYFRNNFEPEDGCPASVGAVGDLEMADTCEPSFSVKSWGYSVMRFSLFGDYSSNKKSRNDYLDTPDIYGSNKHEGRITPDSISELKPNEIFVFGSNLAGMHGGGTARIARLKFGAKLGVGVGLQGQSYGIPTMQGGVDTIRPYVNQFIDYAKTHPTQHFLVTRIGCGIAGFSAEEIAPLFADAADISNISLPQDFWNEIQIS